MQKQNERIKQRLKSVMMGDRVDGLEALLTVLQSDLHVLLGNYMHLKPDSIKLQLEVAQHNVFHLSIQTSADRLIDVGKMIF